MQRTVGVAASRGGYSSSMQATQVVRQTRQRVAEFIGAKSAADLAFTSSCTDALSTAIFGMLNPGDHAIATVVDHNSVIRPLMHLRDTGVITLTVVDCNEQGLVAAKDIADAILDNTALVTITHASNVLGTIQPVEAIGEICRTRGVAFLLDAAQTLGHLPIDVRQIGCQFLAAPGHKGLYGPLGTGVLYVCPGVAERLQPLRFGGSGSERIDQGQPTTMPAMLESGSQNVPAIAGLGAGVEFTTSRQGADAIRHADELAAKALSGISRIGGVRVYGPAPGDQRIPVIAFSIKGYDSATVAGILDSSFQVQTRSGFHCAPLLHQRIGTDVDGLTRISVGAFNTVGDVTTAVDAIREMAGGY